MLEVSTSGFYAWLQRSPCAHEQPDVLLGDRIEAIFRRSRSAYARPGLHAEPIDEGARISGKRIACLMRNRDLCGASRRRTTVPTIRDRDVADAADRLWAADITYVPTWTGFLYLAIVRDVFSRRVVGWAMADHIEAWYNPLRRHSAVGYLTPVNFERGAQLRRRSIQTLNYQGIGSTSYHGGSVGFGRACLTSIHAS